MKLQRNRKGAAHMTMIERASDQPDCSHCANRTCGHKFLKRAHAGDNGTPSGKKSCNFPKPRRNVAVVVDGKVHPYGRGGIALIVVPLTGPTSA